MSVSNLNSMEYLLSNHNTLIGVNTTIPVPDPGDDPDSGVYDIITLVRMKKIAAGLDGYVYDEYYDLNCDGVIDDADIKLMRRYLLGDLALEDMPIYKNLNLVEESTI